MKHFLFERKKDQREFPLLDVQLEQWRLWTLLILMLGGTIAWIGFAASFTFHPYWVMALMDDICRPLFLSQLLGISVTANSRNCLDDHAGPTGGLQWSC